MHRGVHASVVLTPLIIGLGFLLFALFTEYWTSLDFSQVKKYERNSTAAASSDQLIKYRNSNYYLRRHRIEFPKYTSLFGECNEYKLIEILEPVPVTSTPALASSSSSGGGGGVFTTKIIESTTAQVADTPSESLYLKSADNNNNNVCMSREECQSQLPQSSEEHSCFCCSKPSDSKNGKQEQQSNNEDEEEEGKLH